MRKQLAEYALKLLYEVIENIPENSPERLKAEKLLDEVPTETLLSYRPEALEEAIRNNVRELDPVPLAIAKPDTFLTIAPDMPPFDPGNRAALSRIRKGEPMRPEDAKWETSDGKSYGQEGLAAQPGYSQIQQLFFDSSDPYALRTRGHEGRHRSTEMRDSGIENILLQFESPEYDLGSSPTWREDVATMLERPETPVFTQKDFGRQIEPLPAGRSGNLWKLLGLAPVMAAGAEE